MVRDGAKQVVLAGYKYSRRHVNKPGARFPSGSCVLGRRPITYGQCRILWKKSLRLVAFLISELKRESGCESLFRTTYLSSAGLKATRF